MGLMDNSLFSTALIILGFGFLIFVHELGHFLVAKMVGIKTTQFAIGFGHSMLTWRKGIGFRVGTTEPEYAKRLEEGADPKTLGETEYRLNYIPLGGYVKMLGQEDMDPSARSDDPRAFNNKSVSARFAVISAGVIMNVIFGMIFFVIAFMSGVMFNPAQVGGVAPLSPAATTYAQGHDGEREYLGLQIGDTITHIDGEPIGDMMDLKSETILAKKGSALALLIERKGEDGPLTYNVTPRIDPNMGLLSIGIAPPTSLEVDKFEKDPPQVNPLQQSGVRKGMLITHVDDKPVEDYRDYHAALTAKHGQPATVTFTDPKSGETVKTTASAYPQLTLQEDAPPSLLGLVPAVIIKHVGEDTPAKKAGIQVNDLIASIDGKPWPDDTTLRATIAGAGDRPLDLVVWRDGEEISLGPVKPDNGKFGFYPTYNTESPIIGQTLPGSPMDTSAPITGGSKLIAVNDKPVNNWADFQRLLGTVAGDQKNIKLTFELNLTDNPRETATVALDAEQIETIRSAAWLAPLPDGMPAKMLKVSIVGDDPAAAIALGFKKTRQFIIQTYKTLVRLTQGSVPADKLSGPVGIVHQGAIIAENGWEYLLFFLGLISINLAVINFLPIPITDGGQAIFLAVEKIKGSPVSVQVQTIATVAGLALLGVVFLYVTYNDVLRIFNGY